MIDCTICGLTAHGTGDICTDCWYQNFSGNTLDIRQPGPVIVHVLSPRHLAWHSQAGSEWHAASSRDAVPAEGAAPPPTRGDVPLLHSVYECSGTAAQTQREQQQGVCYTGAVCGLHPALPGGVDAVPVLVLVAACPWRRRRPGAAPAHLGLGLAPGPR